MRVAVAVAFRRSDDAPLVTFSGPKMSSSATRPPSATSISAKNSFCVTINLSSFGSWDVYPASLSSDMFDRKEMMSETHDSKCMSAGHAGNFVQRHRAVGVEGCECMTTFVICSEALDSLINIRATSFRPHNDTVLCQSTHLVKPIYDKETTPTFAHSKCLSPTAFANSLDAWIAA